MPTAAPTIPPSVIGVSKTRVLPYLVCRPRCSERRRRNSRCPHRRPRRCRRAPSSRRWPNELPRSWSSRSSSLLHLSTLPLQMWGHLLEDILEDAAGACDPTVEQGAVCLGLFAAANTSRSASAIEWACCSSDQSPRAMRWFFRRSMGSPSGHDFHSSAGRYRDGSSDVECAAAR